QPLVMGDGQEMELVPVIVEGQAGSLLEGLRREIQLRLGPERKMLLPPRHQRLLEEAADRFAPDQSQETGTVGQRKDALRNRRAQPLEVERQVRRVEFVPG